MDERYLLGIDIGSTTIKLALYKGEFLYHDYRRHNTQIIDTLTEMLTVLRETLGNLKVDLALCGSAGLGLAERFGLPFIQEVVAAAKYLKHYHPDVRTFIEIGGEDAKIIFFDEQFRPQIKMNGSCAGGTGAFIDQMAVLLNVSLEELDLLAQKGNTIYPIASRCGVFAKTDIQSLLSNHVSKEDIAASVFRAVALQVIASLARGNEVRKKVLFGGGPFAFCPALTKAFTEVLHLDGERDISYHPHPELLAAMGTALFNDSSEPLVLSEFISLLSTYGVSETRQHPLPPLFNSEDEKRNWEERFNHYKAPRRREALSTREPLFLGIDAGSTTTKMVLIDEKKRIVMDFYALNDGDTLSTLKKGLKEFKDRFTSLGIMPSIARAVATGYGENLIRAALGIEDGIVETMAHYMAAVSFISDVSFILDIGGQDMKALYIHDNLIEDVQINEACSSGCGSFIETFARMLNRDVASLANLACLSTKPFDLGTRCTVFMNSRIKQALKEGVPLADIAAGLSYAVIKNSLYKVLKLKDPSVLGDKIVVQGGTFLNPAVLRALEILLGKEVIRPDIAPLMGAFGAALKALSLYEKGKAYSPPLDLSTLEERIAIQKSHESTCRGCENICKIQIITFGSGHKFVTGNRCERIHSNDAPTETKGVNLVSYKLRLLFDRPYVTTATPRLVFGIPRVLDIYENFPFWCTLLTTLGFQVVPSGPSQPHLLEKAVGTVMSDNICFPAKLAHGHIVDLIDKGIDRIFYPSVVYEANHFTRAQNSYNCPVVTGYPHVLRAAINPEGFGIPIDSPPISFKDENLLEKQLYNYFKTFGITKREIHRAVQVALAAQQEFRDKLKEAALSLLDQEKITVVLAGRPYHSDPLINHGIPELLAHLGVNVIPEDALPLPVDEVLKKRVILTQWAFPNRILAAAEYLSKQKRGYMVQLTSFGCGIDAVIADEVREIMKKENGAYLLIKIDEIMNLGAAKIRLRAFIESLKERSSRQKQTVMAPAKGELKKHENNRIIIAPWFSPYYSPFLPQVLEPFGCTLEVLPPQERSSVEIGLRYVNNDMCYPAVIVIGDVIRALQSGKYNPETTTVLLTQTFGQCRATNYLPLLRKALDAAGFPQVPVISVAASDESLKFSLGADAKELIKRLAIGLMFNDAINAMMLATMPHAKNPLTVEQLRYALMEEVVSLVNKGKFTPLIAFLSEAISAFNSLELHGEPVPAVGLVGEIFVKYNPFSNENMVSWFQKQKIEVVLPSLVGFFTQRFVNEEFDQRHFLKRSWKDRMVLRFFDAYVHHFLLQVEKTMRSFRFYRKSYNIHKLAAETQRVISLVNQSGEGWLLTAEMIALLKNNINHILCLQPFGCLANHITGKGVDRKLKTLYPHLNLHFIDLDAGTSEANIYNRLQLIVDTLKEETLREGMVFHSSTTK